MNVAFVSWLLLQQDAARRDLAALMLFLKRERIAKERRAKYWRLWWTVEHAGEDSAAKAEAEIVRAQAARWREYHRDCQAEMKRLAREQFDELFLSPKERDRRQRLRSN